PWQACARRVPGCARWSRPGGRVSCCAGCPKPIPRTPSTRRSRSSAAPGIRIKRSKERDKSLAPDLPHVFFAPKRSGRKLGVSTHTYYQALPPRSGLFRKLRRDRDLSALYCQLTLLGPGPFHLSDLDPSEVNDTLDWLAEEEEAFGSRVRVDRTMDELRRELDRIMISHPGIERRAAYFEQVHNDIEEFLCRELKLKGYRSAAALV